MSGPMATVPASHRPAHRQETPELDPLDRRILLACQAGLPLVAQPYHALAETLKVKPKILMERMRRMQDMGIIRRIGAIPNHSRLGYRANGMTVWDVADEQVSLLGKQVGELAFVSHCYRRPRHLPLWPYNLFAMVHGHDRDAVQEQIQTIKNLLGTACQAYDVLFSTRILKKTGLRIDKGQGVD